MSKPRRRRTGLPWASPVTITHADGTVEILPAKPPSARPNRTLGVPFGKSSRAYKARKRSSAKRKRAT